MRFSVRFTSSVATLLVLLALARSGAAADQKTIVDKIKSQNQAATSAYGASDFEEMKSKLFEALALGNENGLGKSKIIAQTYVLLGVLQVDGFKDNEAGVKFFAKALEISPAAQLPNGMATKAVKAAFKRAEDEDTGAPAAEPETAEAPKSQKAKKEEAANDLDQERQRAASLSEKRRAEQAAAAEKRQSEQAAAAERKQAEAERKEKEKLLEDLAQAKVSESLGQAEKDKLQKEKQDKDKQLADGKSRIAMLEKDKAEREKQLADVKGRLALAETAKAEKDKQLADAKGRIQQLEKDKADRDKWLAATKDSEKKERDAKEKLEKERPERDKQLADARGRIQQLEKDKADRDKWLVATKDSEKKEREAKERLEKGLQEVAARDKDRKEHEEEERREREKLEAGPDLPGHIGEPITCTIPDEVQAGADLYVHCVPQPGVGAKVVALYYRPSGSVLYNAVTMDRSKKGWYVAVIPGSKINGKVLNYYVEARDGRQAVAASNGKANSPNIATVKAGGAAHRGKSR